MPIISNNTTWFCLKMCTPRSLQLFISSFLAAQMAVVVSSIVKPIRWWLKTLLHSYSDVKIQMLQSFWSFDPFLVGAGPTPLKNHGVNVSWDDDIPNWMEKHVPNHQPDPYLIPSRLVISHCPDTNSGSSSGMLLASSPCQRVWPPKKNWRSWSPWMYRIRSKPSTIHW